MTDDNSTAVADQRANAALWCTPVTTWVQPRSSLTWTAEPVKVAAATAGAKRLSGLRREGRGACRLGGAVSAGVSKGQNIAGSKTGNDDINHHHVRPTTSCPSALLCTVFASLVNNESGATVGMLAPTSGDKLAGGVAFGGSRLLIVLTPGWAFQPWALRGLFYCTNLMHQVGALPHLRSTGGAVVQLRNNIS